MQTAGLISIFLLAIALIALALNRKYIKQGYTRLATYCILVFVYELSLAITALLKVNNNFIANIHSLIYFPFAFFLLFRIYSNFYKNHRSLIIIQMVLVVLVIIGWILDNLIMGNIILFNSMMPWFASIVLLAGCVYLINVLLFNKNSQFLKDPDVLITCGILVRSVIWTFSLWLLDFETGFNRDFIMQLLLFTNIGLCISDVFFIYAIRRIGVTKKLKEVIRG
jgi:hypothetical protein